MAPPCTRVESAASWEEWEKLAADMGEAVRELKGSGADQGTVQPYLDEMLHRKEQLRAALEAAIAATPDEAAAEPLKAKLAEHTPKLNKKDKKKEKAAGGSAADAEKQANIKAQEEAKAAARARKKAEAEAKKSEAGTPKAAPVGKPDNGAAKPAADAKSAANPPPAAAPKPATATAAKPAAAKPNAAGGSIAPAPAEKKKAFTNKTAELSFIKETPPLLAILASRLAKCEIALKRVEAKQLSDKGAPCLVLPLGSGSYSGEMVIARYFARYSSAGSPPSLLYGTPGDACSATDVDQWIERANSLATASGPALAEALVALNTRLAMRTVIAGHAVTLADAAVWLAFKSNAAVAKQAASFPVHVKRWLKFMDVQPACVVVAQDFFGAQKDAGSMEMNLTNAEIGQVVTRFPPEPSGHLHIGHVKAAMLNSYYATRYDGKMRLRFDDTNPSKEKEEYEEAIILDLARLEIRPDIISHTSDWFKEIQEIAERMVVEGLAYMDPSPQEEQQKLRYERKENAYRSQPIEENLRLWKELLAGSEEGQKCCLRAKIDMSSDNGSLRDPAVYRCNLTPHARTKDTYKAYPTYDLACPIVDSLEGVTHALRDRQYKDRDDQYQWFIKNLRLREVYLESFSRINFVRTLLSKRKLQWLIDEKKAVGWDDPRFPTVAGILRRGMTVEGLKTFILSMGASKNTNLMEWDKIWATNRTIIDPKATRYMALLSDGLVPFKLSNGPSEVYAETIFRHPKDESLGKKVRLFGSTLMLQADDAASLAVDEEVTLMSWGNAIVRGVNKDANGKVVGIEGELHLEGDIKKTKKKITWLADTPDLVDVELVDLDFLLSKDKIEEEDDLEEIFTENSILPYTARGEAALRTVRKGETIQIERRGFYICDAPYVRPSDPMRFYFVPDGKNMMGVKP